MATDVQSNTITFTTTNPAIAKLLELDHEIADLGQVAALASWDQQTQMSMDANNVRGSQLGTIQTVIHQRITAPEHGEAIAQAEAAINGALAQFTDADRGLVRKARREYDEAVKIPAAFIAELATVTADAWEKWMAARQAKDFSIFAPALAKVTELCRQQAKYLAPDTSPYAALFALYEPGMDLQACLDALEQVRVATVPLIKRVQAAQQIDESIIQGDFDTDIEMKLAREMLSVIGYNFDRGRIDLAAHPFATSIGSPFDVRVTTRTNRANIGRAIMPVLHEGGHALYEQGIDEALSRTTLANGTSLGIHESQSRFWENIIGRSSFFWQTNFAKVQQSYPEALGSLNADQFARALNIVEPSLIRVEADELTYNLHIIIRVELELALINGEIEVSALRDLWNQKCHDYLGIMPPDDVVGVLQDVHWSWGSIGYFATYTLGNLYAAQFTATLRRTFPDLDARLAAGETSFIREWQREQIHRWGSIYNASEICERVTGEKLNPQYFIDYITNKMTALYNLA